MNQLIQFLENNPQASMSIYRHPYENRTQFVFQEVKAFEGITLNWLYERFIVSYRNDIFDINIKSATRHMLHNTLRFGKVVFDKMIYDVLQIKKMKKRRIGIITLIKKYFMKFNEFNIYRPSVAELVLKINTLNEEKRTPNKTCCCCLQEKYINDEPIFGCTHVELCWSCYFKLPNNTCPICRATLQQF